MDALYYLIPVAGLLGAVGLGGFLWSLHDGQYDDLDGAAFRILPDTDRPESVAGIHSGQIDGPPDG